MACALSPVSRTSSRDLQLLSDRGLHRSISNKDLLGRAQLQKSQIRRSFSDNHLCYTSSQIKASMVGPKLKTSRPFGFFKIELPGVTIPDTLKALLLDTRPSRETKMEENFEESDREEKIEIEKVSKKQINWVERLMELKRNWKEKEEKDEIYFCGEIEGCDDGCEVDYEDDAEESEITIDKALFTSLVEKVAWSDTKLISQLAFLCNMAYVIADIKNEDLKRYYNLELITSSLEKKAEVAAIRDKIEQDSIRSSDNAETNSESSEQKPRLRPKAAYEIAASAACFVHSRTKELISEPQLRDDYDGIHMSEMAASVAASAITAVIAAGEDEKEAAAIELQSLHSSPCEWFVCDDSNIYTRHFVIQGSDSLASWQANLFFEPTKFEGTDVLVHRGIYEAAKGIYDQFMPEIEQHLEKFGDRAKLQFTGHSLGGSLALLVNLMLLTRKKVQKSNLLPVVTFGSPFIFCGGHKILEQVGLDEKHVHCVMMHRDIVPRAFSCNYPNYVAQLLKKLNGKFRFHTCLNKNKLLYSPMGKLFIVQPDEKSSPHHPLLPTDKGIYEFKNNNSSLIKKAIQTFLNSPHPLETLKDPTAYGSEGTILRDHDSSNYLKAVNGILREQTTKLVRKARKQRNEMWPLLTSRSPHAWNTEDMKGRQKVLTGL